MGFYLIFLSIVIVGVILHILVNHAWAEILGQMLEIFGAVLIVGTVIINLAYIPENRVYVDNYIQAKLMYETSYDTVTNEEKAVILKSVIEINEDLIAIKKYKKSFMTNIFWSKKLSNLDLIEIK